MAPGIPPPFLEVRVHDTSRTPGLLALCAGYEGGGWRSVGLADHLMEWLPDFALPLSDLADAHSGQWVRFLRRAARLVYESEKFRNRGEFGELLLHAAMRQVFGSLPAISKIRYKSARNETVKGFDAVHVVGDPEDLELWLGEAKFYSDYAAAAASVVTELRAHTERDYLRDEFLLIRGKIDPSLPHADVLGRLLDENVSLDEVFRRVVVPVLITYDSECLGTHSACTPEFVAQFEREAQERWSDFAARRLPTNAAIHLLLVPLNTKEVLIRLLDERLRAWQTI